MAWKIAICDGCQVEDPSMIILKDNIWLSIAEKKEILCYTCIEKRLNRRLTIEDLKPDVHITKLIMLGLRMGHGIPEPKNIDVRKLSDDLAFGGIGTRTVGRKSKLQHGISLNLNGHMILIPSKSPIKEEELKAVQGMLSAFIEAGIFQYEKLRKS